MLLATASISRAVNPRPASFRRWQHELMRQGTLPIIGVAGSRGKSTVIRMIDAVLRSAGLRSATWTNTGVEILGRRQRGELGAWSQALQRLATGSLDVVIQELDWATVNAVGLPPASYATVAVTNLCGNNEACLLDEHTRSAFKAMPKLLDAVAEHGALVLNLDDYQLASGHPREAALSFVTAVSKESPILRQRLSQGQYGVWLEQETLVFGDSLTLPATPVIGFDHLPLTLGGDARFQASNAMTAIAICLAMGLDVPSIQDGLDGFQADPKSMPGSFNCFAYNGARVVVDRIDPSWFLRPVLRALNPGAGTRQITVIGPLTDFPLDDVKEVGRLLGRYFGGIMVHSSDDDDWLREFRKGVSTNRVPPLIAYLPTERRAINRLLKNAREGDALLVLTSTPATAIRAIQRAISATAGPAASAPALVG
jgi:cyanophycin synthetase